MPVKIVGIIPARYASTRFPGKPLALVAGKPLIRRVVEQCQKAKSLSEIIVATDDSRIVEAVKKLCRVEMTSPSHPSGSDRIAEVAGKISCDAVVNIQGDEPTIEPSVIDSVAGALADCEMSTAATRIKNPAELENPNVVKVVVNAAGRALYFSRRTIPYLRDKVGQASRLSSEREGASEGKIIDTDSAQDLGRRDARPALAAIGSTSEQLAAFAFLKHLGIYGYRRETLLRLVKFPVSPLEAAEKLEQLRALENGIQIAVMQVAFDSVGVDAPEDVEWVERFLKK
jgi:3-deoxy-manno-octulosonate cytidylyltransferase (CMP-KDO synthetase)